MLHARWGGEEKALKGQQGGQLELWGAMQGAWAFSVGNRGTSLSSHCYRLGCYNNRHLFLAVLKAWKSKIKVLDDSVSSKSPGLQMATFSLCLHKVCMCGESLWSHFF